MNEIMRIKNILLLGTLLLSTTIFAQSNPDKSIGWYWAIEPKVGMTVGDFSEGLATISNNRWVWGYIDKKGEVVILPQFDDAGQFSEGLAYIKKHGKYGYIDKKGEIVVPLQFEDAYPFSDGVALVKQSTGWCYIDRAGKIVLQPRFNNAGIFSDGLALCKVNDKWGYMDKTGKLAIKPQFGYAYSFSGGLAKIWENGKYGYINPNGEIVIAPQFDNGGDFSEGLAVIKQNDKWGYIDKTGKIIISPQFDDAGRFSDGLAVVIQNGKWGYIDKTGKTIITQQFDEAAYFSDGLALVKQDWKYGYIAILPPMDQYLKEKVEPIINDWQIKGEFESTAQWQVRVNEATRKRKIDELALIYKREYLKLFENQYSIDDLELMSYDADNQSFLIKSVTQGDMLLPVPLSDAPAFKANWDNVRYSVKAEFVPSGNNAVLNALVFRNGKKTYRYDSHTQAKYAITNIQYNFAPIDIPIPSGNTAALNNRANIEQQNLKVGVSHVDTNIPVTTIQNDKTFAVIIANEKYQKESTVPFAVNDGKIFSKYCEKTLGIPTKNIHYVENATFNNMRYEIDWLKEVIAAYNGTAHIIFYYAGHGIPDESSKAAYLLPVDGYSSNVTTGYKMDYLYKSLGSLPSQSVTVFLDACFSGAKRDGAMLSSARGIAIKPKEDIPVGNMVVFAASQGAETAYPNKEQGHGMFTYYLLKKLQESKGDVNYVDLSNYLTEQVRQQSIVQNSKSQTPTVIPSSTIGEAWKSWNLMK